MESFDNIDNLTFIWKMSIFLSY